MEPDGTGALRSHGTGPLHAAGAVRGANACAAENAYDDRVRGPGAPAGSSAQPAGPTTPGSAAADRTRD